MMIGTCMMIGLTLAHMGAHDHRDYRERDRETERQRERCRHKAARKDARSRPRGVAFGADGMVLLPA